MIILLTCETPECENSNIAIPYEKPADICICGACGIIITNKVEV
jgi:hypothetical protein